MIEYIGLTSKMITSKYVVHLMWQMIGCGVMLLTVIFCYCEKKKKTSSINLIAILNSSNFYFDNFTTVIILIYYLH